MTELCVHYNTFKFNTDTKLYKIKYLILEQHYPNPSPIRITHDTSYTNLYTPFSLHWNGQENSLFAVYQDHSYEGVSSRM